MFVLGSILPAVLFYKHFFPPLFLSGRIKCDDPINAHKDKHVDLPKQQCKCKVLWRSMVSCGRKITGKQGSA